MARKDRLNEQAFTCANDRFQTNIDKPFPHGEGEAGGSVFDGPLFDNKTVSLWLEHVRDAHQPNKPFYWLMWYNAKGDPTIPLSGVMSADDVRTMVGRLARFVELP